MSDPTRSKIRRVVVVYPHADRVSCPDAIGRHLAEELGRHFDVELLDWDAASVPTASRDAALVGHPHPLPFTPFRRGLRRGEWARTVLLQPFNLDLRQIAHLDPFVRRVYHFLAITGPYWFQRVGSSPVAYWAPRMTRSDLAVDRRDFPVLRTHLSPPGRRRFVFIGGNVAAKNTSYLSAIARAAPDLDISWIGGGPPIDAVRPLGWHDFGTEVGRAVVAGFDVMVTVGTADANPATILEAMAWGLVPVCTPQSGYMQGPDGVVNVPIDDVNGAVAALRVVRDMSVADFVSIRERNWRDLDSRFTWRRFAETVMDALDKPRVRLRYIPPTARLRLFMPRWQSSLQPWRRQGQAIAWDLMRRRIFGAVSS